MTLTRPDSADETSSPQTARSKRSSRSGLQMTLNLAPMIDVTFLLLTFFLVTTTFKRAEGVFAAALPRDAGAPSAALPISPIVVRINQDSPGGYQIRVDNATRSPQTFDELARFLVDFQANPGFDRQTPVVIYPGPTVEWDHVVNAWNAAVRAKCETITFAGQ
ncbi:MAG: ExbD/TolR family protein [Phycisphaerae bacterium]